MPQYFIAFEIEPTPELLALQKKLGNAGEVIPLENFHITLLFLGDNCDVEKTKEIISKIEGEPFEVEVERFIEMSDNTYKRSIALEIKDIKRLSVIRDFLLQLIQDKSVWPFKPHISLIRTNKKVKLPKIKTIKLLLKRIYIAEAARDNGIAKYEFLYTKSFDKFEDKVFKVLEDLKGLQKIKHVQAGALYGSTAMRKIKQPVHDIDLHLILDTNTTQLETLDEIKKFIAELKKKYETDELEISTWAVGLGKVFEAQKVQKKMFHLGIEFFLVPRMSLGDILGDERDLHCEKILFGNIPSIIKGRRVKKIGLELTMSRFLSVILESGLNKRTTETYSKQFSHSYFSSTKKWEDFPNSLNGVTKTYKSLLGVEAVKSFLMEYPEFVLKGKRNFVYFIDINKIPKAPEGYIRHIYHKPNLLFLKELPEKLNDYMIYPAQNKFIKDYEPFFVKALDGNKKLYRGTLPTDVRHFLLFSTFTVEAAEITLKPLYYMHSMRENQFVFWYASMATICQTAFAFLLLNKIYETDPEKMFAQIRKLGFKDFDFETILEAIRSQKVENVEKLFSLACEFINRMAKKFENKF